MVVLFGATVHVCKLSLYLRIYEVLNVPEVSIGKNDAAKVTVNGSIELRFTSVK